MTNMDFTRLARANVATLIPYTPVAEPMHLSRTIKLDANESMIGPSPTVATQLEKNTRRLKYYPDANGQQLKSTLADVYDVSPSQITLGNGSNDVLDTIARVFSGPGDQTLFSQYGFAVYPIVSQSAGASPVMVPSHHWGHDLEKILNAITVKTKIVYLANPNNPTGTWFETVALEDFLARVPQNVIVVLDEAYIEYTNGGELPDGLDYLEKYPNLIVTRTFSKAYGLAALRIGYAISHSEIADLLNRVRQPFNVNRFGLIAANAAIGDIAHLEKTVWLTRAGMQQWLIGLHELELSYIPSQGNFLCVNVGDGLAAARSLARRNIFVCPLTNYGMSEFIRITIGTEEENRAVLKALAHHHSAI